MKQIFQRASVILLATATAANAAGLPQLDHTWYANQVLWLVVCFIVLYILVAHFIAPTVDGVLSARTSAIGDAIRDAEVAKRDADQTRTAFESEGQSARSTAAELIGKIQAELSKDATAANHKLSADLARKTEQADARIADAKTKAMGHMQTATVGLAQAMASKLLGKNVDASEVEQSVTRLMKASTNG